MSFVAYLSQLKNRSLLLELFLLGSVQKHIEPILRFNGKHEKQSTSGRMEIRLKMQYPSIKINPIVNQQPDLNWCLGILVNGWMRVIGIDPNTPIKKDWRWLAWFIQRWSCFFLSAGVNICMMYLFYQNMKEEISKKKSSTSLWNQWLDFTTTTIHSISTHLCLLLFVTNNWNTLKMVMNEAEHLIKDPQVINRMRIVVPITIIAFILMVIIKQIYLPQVS